MSRLICWWRRHHTYGPWTEGILIRFRFCDVCGKRDLREKPPQERVH
jgi:hypothetical protein